MTILLAPDSFKDALSALEACEALKRGVRRALPSATVRLFPLADGGEGTAEVLAWHLKGELVEVTVSDPLFKPIVAHYFSFGKTAFIEMAQASGLERLSQDERNPLKTSTFGTGELIKHAIAQGMEEVYLAIGGSATNDGGMGMAAALGWQFLDGNGKALTPIGENLKKVVSVLPPNPEVSGQVPQSPIRNPQSAIPIPEVSGQVPQLLCDVTNPLYGLNGAAYVFANQKGADEDAVVQLDDGLRHFAAVVAEQLGTDFSQLPGAGAAGGLGFGAMAFLGARVQGGADAILQLTGFEEAMSGADLLLTGEGCLDRQTGQGKLVAAICRRAKAYSVPVVAICGAVDADESAIEAMGLQAALQIRERGEPLESSIARTAKGLETLSYKVLKTM
ncbi:MAG: glycerate kinase [Saprospiraceae bacterium]|nr:glycerate kinase [Saprospiraceae bacterium]